MDGSGSRSGIRAGVEVPQQHIHDPGYHRSHTWVLWEEDSKWRSELLTDLPLKSDRNGFEFLVLCFSELFCSW